MGREPSISREKLGTRSQEIHAYWKKISFRKKQRQGKEKNLAPKEEREGLGITVEGDGEWRRERLSPL